MFGAPKKKTNIEINRVHITPAKASEILAYTASSGFPQRPIIQRAVIRLSQEMSAGTWHSATGDVIRLCDYKGGSAVLDGQHRLAAVARSKKGQDFWVADHVPEDAFKYIDQGTTRTLTHIAGAAGWPNAGQLSAAGRMLVENINGRDPVINKGTGIAAGSLFDMISEVKPDLVTTWMSYGSLLKKAAKASYIKDSGMVFLFHYWEGDDHDRSVKVLEYLAHNADVEPPSKVYRFALHRLRANHETFLSAANSGNSIRTEVQKAMQLRVLQFAWLSDSGKAGQCTTSTGFLKAFNRWLKDQPESGSWEIV